jgi:hypothetical protein
MSSSISIELPLTLSYAILDYKDEPCENGFFNIYIKCSGYIIAKMAFTFQPKYVEYLDNLKKNISKMKRRVSMDVKHGLTIDNLVFKYMSAQKMIKNDGDETYNEDNENPGIFEISFNHLEDNFFHVTIPFNDTIIDVFENFVKWIERRRI